MKKIFIAVAVFCILSTQTFAQGSGPVATYLKKVAGSYIINKTADSVGWEAGGDTLWVIEDTLFVPYLKATNQIFGTHGFFTAWGQAYESWRIGHATGPSTPSLFFFDGGATNGEYLRFDTTDATDEFQLSNDLDVTGYVHADSGDFLAFTDKSVHPIDINQDGASNDQVMTWDGTDWSPADAPGAAGGETNTASNVGVGYGWFKQKAGVDFEFKSLASLGGIIKTLTGDSITLALNPDGITIDTTGGSSALQVLVDDATIEAGPSDIHVKDGGIGQTQIATGGVATTEILDNTVSMADDMNTFTSSELRTQLTNKTGTGAVVFSASPSIGNPYLILFSDDSADSSGGSHIGLIQFQPTSGNLRMYWDTSWKTFYHGKLMTGFDGTAYRTFYSDASGDVQEIAHGTNGYVWTTNGPSANPSWQVAGAGTSYLDSSKVKTDTIVYQIVNSSAQGGINDTVIEFLIDTSDGEVHIQRTLGGNLTFHGKADSAIVSDSTKAFLASDATNEDVGDITIVGGSWAVENNSHNHTTTTISGLLDANMADDALDPDKLVGDNTDDNLVDSSIMMKANTALTADSALNVQDGSIDRADLATDAVLLNDIGDPDGNTVISLGTYGITFNIANPSSNAFELNATGAFSGHLLHVHQSSGNPGATHLVHIEAADPDVLPLCVWSGQDTVAIFGGSGALTLTSWIDSSGNFYIGNELHINKDSISGDAVIKFSDVNQDETIHWDQTEDRFEFSDDVSITGDILVSGTVDGVDVAARDVVLGQIINDTASWNDHVNDTLYYIFTVPDPDAYFALDAEWIIDKFTTDAITIVSIDVTLDADPTTEFEFSLKFADAFIGFANATVIDDTATVAGVTTVTGGFGDATVPADRVIYFVIDADPDDAITQAGFKIGFTVD